MEDRRKLKFTPELFIKILLVATLWEEEMSPAEVHVKPSGVLRRLVTLGLCSETEKRYIEGPAGEAYRIMLVQNAGRLFRHPALGRREKLRPEASDRRRTPPLASPMDMMLFLEEEGRNAAHRAVTEVVATGLTRSRYFPALHEGMGKKSEVVLS